MTSKYANLPDIDSARDVYETEDIDENASRDVGNIEIPVSKGKKADFSQKGHSDDDDDIGPLPDSGISQEELDSSRLPERDEVGRFFRRAERRRPKKTVYAYPVSPGGSRSPSPTDASSSKRAPPLRTRLRALQQELHAIEAEMADPSNPLLFEEGEGGPVDMGEMLKGLVEVRGRLSNLGGLHIAGTKREGLVEKAVAAGKIDHQRKSSTQSVERQPTGGKAPLPDSKTLVELDHRISELEKVMGSNNTALDESSPLPPPLLPQVNRLSNQLHLLTQPRHIDSISRRLKLLLADLERYQTVTKRPAAKELKDGTSSTTQGSNLLPDLAPILQRLSPLLPTIPHLLQRLRTLSTLHASTSSFAATLTTLEEEQRKVRSSMGELGEAIGGVEKSINDNLARVEGNLKGMESRLDDVMARLALLSSEQQSR
ncbi:hypothetical protein FRB99_006034 [Tulasnella sp. 403]|nr:hypothetical protein FRB99_006034 [Tulasnella sp. 403]